MCRGCVSPVSAFAVIVAVLSVTVHTEDEHADGRLFEISLPGGVRGALASIDDHTPADRSQFLLEVIRRFHYAPAGGPADPRLEALGNLLTRLRTSSLPPGMSENTRETVPLPLPPSLWIDAVFAGGATADTLVSAILQSRNASLLYCGLLSLDDATRHWLAGKRDLVAYLASQHPGTFLVAAPGLRVNGGRLRLPGGEAAEPVWRALTGAELKEPTEFIRTIVNGRKGRLAYFLGAMSQVSPAQLTYALRLDSPDPDVRVAAARKIYEVFERLALRWEIDPLPFWRPTLDPAMLLVELRTDERGRPMLPGSRAFWSGVLGEKAVPAGAEGGSVEPVDFAWLCERVFSGVPVKRPLPYDMVLFASRRLDRVRPDGLADAIEMVRASGRYPALTMALERANLGDIGVYAAAARRAATLDAVTDRTRSFRVLAQYQGLLALITRAAVRGGLPRDSLPALVTSLSHVDVGERGEYEGRLVRWLDDHLLPLAGRVSPPSTTGEPGVPDAQSPGWVESRLQWMLAGAVRSDAEFVDWEGTRYRVDLPTAEATRIARVLGDSPLPFLSWARELLRATETLTVSPARGDPLRPAAELVTHVAGSLARVLGDDEAREYRETANALQRAARAGDRRLAPRLAPALRILADDLLARGVLELTYAVALGRPGVTPIDAGEAASRHDFDTEGPLPSRAWVLPDAGAWKERPWHVRGSLLGLDVRLSQFSLMRVSSRPPPRRPSLSEIDRRVFIEAVSLIQPAALSDANRDAILAALARGRDRIARARSRADAMAISDEIGLSSARRTLLAWSVVHEPDRVPATFSLSERLWLGADRSSPAGLFDPWGAPGEPRTGCLCLRVIHRGALESLAGRWNTGTLASAFPDLNLRLAELLAELQMPAVLLGHVLAPATVDLVENATSRHQDDRRGLIEFVLALSRERVEEYLALLTTDGPLVPIGVAEEAVTARSPR